MKIEALNVPPKRESELKNSKWRWLFVAFWCLLTGLPAFAQEEAYRVTLDLKEVTLSAFAEEVTEQTGLAVFYKDDVAQAVEPITVSVTDAPLREVLQTVVGAKGCTFAFEGNTVVIRKQAPRPVVEEVNLRGRVTDTQGMPLPGVTVLVKEMSIGTATDTDGRYQLTVPMLSDTTFTLAFSFVGFETVSVEYAGQDSINVVLRESVQEMDEVVVTGYQTLRKSDVVGSVATVKAEDILMPAYSSVDQMLQGRVAGMMVMNTSSRVGTTPKIRIRGTSTLLGNQDPLWVVDGVIQPDPISLDASDMMVDDLKNILGNQISWLNPADIETITVLKDASATAIYGSKAANGVIVITTKKGDTGRLTVNYSNNFAFRARPHYGLFNMMNSQERIEFSREAFDAGAVYSSVPVASTDTYEGIMSMYNDKTISREEAETAINRLKGMNTNWLDILTRNSFSQSHNLSLSGGTDKVSANASIGFSNEAGVEVGNNARGLSGRLFVSAQLADNLQVDVNLSGSIDKTYGYAAGVNPMNYALNTSRAVPAYNEDGSLCFLEKRTSYELNSSSVLLGYNVLNEMEHSYSKNKSVNLNGSLNLYVPSLFQTPVGKNGGLVPSFFQVSLPNQYPSSSQMPVAKQERYVGGVTFPSELGLRALYRSPTPIPILNPFITTLLPKRYGI